MRRYGRLSAHLSKHSLAAISLEFTLVYIAVGVLMSFVYWGLTAGLPSPEFGFNKQNLTWFDCLYFSFVSQFTGGYGDIVPKGLAQALAVVQSTFGVLFGGLWAGVVVAKWFTAGDRESIVFAEWAGYALDEERFFVLFVNRNTEDLVDTNINAIVKLAGYNSLPPAVSAPYIGKSAWVFSLARVSLEDLSDLRLYPSDGIKISISGTAGMTRCTNWRRYTMEQVFVLPHREYFRSEAFENPRFDQEFFEQFARPPHEGVAITEFDFARAIQERKSAGTGEDR